MLNDIINQLHYIPMAIFLTALFIVSYIFIKENNKKAKDKFIKVLREDRWIVAFLFYLALLLAGTLMGRPHTDPFVNVLGHIGFGKEDNFLTDGLVNILMFVPYIYLYLQAFRPAKPIKEGACISITTTVLIELCQLLFWIGQFSIGDILYNFVGGMIGCGLWYLINTFIGHKEDVSKKNN